jgi:hypothetical protein
MFYYLAVSFRISTIDTVQQDRTLTHRSPNADATVTFRPGMGWQGRSSRLPIMPDAGGDSAL